MVFKWGIEWCWKNAHRLKFKDKANAVKKKLKIDEGVGLIKNSIETLKNKEPDETDTDTKDEKIS